MPPSFKTLAEFSVKNYEETSKTSTTFHGRVAEALSVRPCEKIRVRCGCLRRVPKLARAKNGGEGWTRYLVPKSVYHATGVSYLLSVV